MWKKSLGVEWTWRKRAASILLSETACFMRRFPCEGRPALPLPCPRLHRAHTRYCQNGKEAFRESDLIQDAVLRNLQTLAESTQRIGDHLKARHPEVDWRAIAGFRNVLVHDYLGINLERIWEIVSVHLPLLSSQIEAIRHEAELPG